MGIFTEIQTCWRDVIVGFIELANPDWYRTQLGITGERT
jgi:hypothetical protein